jgi:hypothetical protein
MKHKQEGKTSIINIYQRSNKNGIGFDGKYIDKIFDPF